MREQQDRIKELEKLYQMEKEKNEDVKFKGGSMAHKTIDDLFNDDKYQDVGNIIVEERDQYNRLTNSDAGFELLDLVSKIENASRLSLPQTSQQIFGTNLSSERGTALFNNRNTNSREAKNNPIGKKHMKQLLIQNSVEKQTDA